MFQIALFKGFPNIPTYPYLRNTEWAQMRQQWHRPLKTHKVGIISNVPERCVIVTSSITLTYSIGDMTRPKQRANPNAVQAAVHC